jgi:hypothetical protein
MSGLKKEMDTRPTLAKNNSKDYLRKYKERALNLEKELHDNI